MCVRRYRMGVSVCASIPDGGLGERSRHLPVRAEAAALAESWKGGVAPGRAGGQVTPQWARHLASTGKRETRWGNDLSVSGLFWLHLYRTCSHIRTGAEIHFSDFLLNGNCFVI